MSKSPKKIPHFNNEDEERQFWAKNSPLDYFSKESVRRATFPELKPTLRSISLRLPEDMIVALKEQANRQDVPYQSLAKVYLAREIKHGSRSARNIRSHPVANS